MSEILTNCHTCGWDRRNADGYHYCTAESTDELAAWAGARYWSPRGLPEDFATGCPPWKPKPAPWPEHIRVGAWVKFAEPIEEEGEVYDGRAQVVSMGIVDGEREFTVSEDGRHTARYPADMAGTFVACEPPKPAAIPPHDTPGHRPDNDRAQLAVLGSLPTPEDDEATVDALMRRAGAGGVPEDDESVEIRTRRRIEDVFAGMESSKFETVATLLARIEALEQRVRVLEDDSRRSRGLHRAAVRGLRKAKLRRGGR